MLLIRPETVTDTSLLSCNILENEYSAWNIATTYGITDRVIVIGTNFHKIYESLQAGNLAYNPTTSPTWWIEVSSTNRWKLFDSSISSQASNPDVIDTTIQLSIAIDSLVLLNVSANTARVIVTDPLEGVVYDVTKNLVSYSFITDWFAYFYEPIVRKTDIYFDKIPRYANATVRIILSDVNNTVLCGALIIGNRKELGAPQYGAKVGIQDYSVKTQNTFGDYTVLQRAFRKTASFTIWVEKENVDVLAALLAQYRAMPIVYIGSDQYSSTIIYGFYKDFSITISYPTTSICTLDLEGLT